MISEAAASTASETATLPDVPSATFPANAGSLGDIPDSDVSTPVCQNDSTTFRDVTFTVSGLSGTVQTVSVNFNASHSYIQDLEVTLTAPSAQSLLLFSATGTTSTTPNACGSHSNDLSSSNIYTFADTASANWWTTAASANPIPTSSNRTVVTGIGGVPSGVPATTSLNTAFAGATANGTWKLRFRDRGDGDTGTVTAANLTITTATVIPQHIVDMNGDGKTDFTVVRNTGGGQGGQLTWYTAFNGVAGGSGPAWGVQGDTVVPVDFDGDNKTDVAVWRAGVFYILQSQTSTVRVDNFGISGDDPTMSADYDGDGKADVAVYRAGPAAGNPSFWYYRGSLNNPNGNITFIQWGQNGDFPEPGDYDGDGKADTAIQRNNGGGQARFWFRMATGAVSSIVFGTPTDVVIPGDYDGDGKTDICTVRGSGGQIAWFIHPSSGGPDILYQFFGLSASDFPLTGDYDGDGKTDLAVWRPSTTPGASAFYIRKSSDGGLLGVPWGQNGDSAVATYKNH